jgi:hypothetical protein
MTWRFFPYWVPGPEEIPEAWLEEWADPAVREEFGCTSEPFKAFIAYKTGRTSGLILEKDKPEELVQFLWEGRHLRGPLKKHASDHLAALSLGREAATGRRVMAGGEKGSRNRHGPPEARQENGDAMRRALEKAHEAHPHWGITALREKVAERFGVCAKTVYRQTAGYNPTRT